MIYREDINKISALCVMAQPTDGNEDAFFCTRTKKPTSFSNTCNKFKYDIFKKTEHRKRRFKKDFNPEDFKLKKQKKKCCIRKVYVNHYTAL